MLKIKNKKTNNKKLCFITYIVLDKKVNMKKAPHVCVERFKNLSFKMNLSK